MPGKSKKRVVGLFLLCAVTAGALVFFYLYWTHGTGGGDLYATYFDESVSGLVPEAPVTYKGVPIGEVEKLALALDGERVEVLFRIHDAYRELVHRDMVTQLQPFGETGLFALGLEQRRPDHTGKSPELDFPTKHRVIPSIPRAGSNTLAPFSQR